MDRSTRIVFLAKAVRTFCYGFLGIVFPIHLSRLGVGPEGIGAAVALTLVGSAAMTVAARRPAERLGGRAILVILAGLTTLAGVLFATTRHPGLVILAAMVGNLAVSVGETGPFLTIEQVLLARTASGKGLTLTMSLYNLVGYGAAALGSLAVALLGRTTSTGEPYAPLFWLFAAGGVVQAVVYARLPAAVAAAPRSSAAPLPSRGLIYRLAALFALDSLAGGFVVQSLIGYWFFVAFGLDLAALGAVFFGTQVLTAVSFLIAARSATRFGLINTMVFSHLLSNGLLISMAFAPTARIAIGLLLARHLLSQMDVPTRQAYLVSVVEDHEREAAVTLTNTARTVAQSVTPAFTGFVMQAVGLSAPLVLGGSLKILYDLLLYAVARGHQPKSERP
jgi:MFS family permease